MRPRFLLILSLIVFAAVPALAAQQVGRPGDPPYQVSDTDMSPPPMEGSACNPDYWNVLYWRAWMEGKHDMEAAQSIIAKPRSVMDLTCFDGKMRALNNSVNPANPYDYLFGNRTEATSGNMGPKIDNILFVCSFCGDPVPVDQAVCVIQRDTDCNCEPSVGSPCGPDPPGGGDFDQKNLDRMLTRVVRESMQVYMQNFSPQGLCGDMNAIWQAAQCNNFDKGRFITFYQSIWSEPRAGTPPAYNCSFGAGATYFPRLGWNLAYNGGRSPAPPSYYYIAGAFPKPYLDGKADESNLGGMQAEVTFLNLLNSTPPLNPQGCSGLMPIPTGVRVYDGIGVQPSVDDDAVCPAPGCHYDRASKRCAP